MHGSHKVAMHDKYVIHVVPHGDHMDEASK